MNLTLSTSLEERLRLIYISLSLNKYTRLHVSVCLYTRTPTSHDCDSKTESKAATQVHASI